MNGPDICRRAVLAGGAGAAAVLTARAGVAAPAGRLDAIGLQLYTLRQLFAPDPLGTLERVAAIGYREVEFGGGGYESMDHAALRQHMDRLGLTAPSLHVPYAFLLNRIDAALGAAEALGARIIVVPWIEPRLRGADAWPAVVATLNRFGERIGKAGLQLAYHNHDFEMILIDGKPAIAWLLEAASPDYLGFEPDVAWIVAGGQDAASMLRQYSGRVPRVHAKDLGDNEAERGLADVGSGRLDWDVILPAIEAAHTEWIVVEHDLPIDPLASIRRSYAFLAEKLKA